MADNQRPEDRLNTPGDRTGFRRSRRLRFNEESFGQFAEWIARFMGSPRFLLWMTVFVVTWIVLNLIGGWRHWDPYPFILLNLAFSTQASYSAPLILLAQNRQEARDKASLDDDRRVNAQSRADMDYLAREIASLRASVGDMATRDFVRSELRDQLRELLFELEHGNNPDEGPEEPPAENGR
ncbi:DUF1003 domain-containing protein [uncultured Propionibacterium sp.]|uniref:DUF1003 domain-containing protein n=1 Tax=uncultured Propionibacterium sp. TaxID=218066 RepID=UPI002931502E|nr:DUF1003 domain-containing protein [uncultured Propionibacterium sp.]